ncbi:hypothetical protein AVEN_237393-1 [Araneus ventricosus]|uniref:Uncharacterized protein n=1 Tax=Araneus ventricosus TaxID=182803 RepID=A0A4Y2JVP0_ARAVE|nr:hypothetical protein AVEN_237393-1 [Araneus ventricosus]
MSRILTGTIKEFGARHCCKKFSDEHWSLEDEKGCRHPSVIDDSQLRAIIEVDSCKTPREFTKGTSNRRHSTSSGLARLPACPMASGPP